MNYKIIILFTFITFFDSYFLFSQNKKLNIGIEEKLHGNIKTIREIQYKMDISFGKSTKGEIRSQNFSILENGNTIERIEYKSSGKLSSKHNYFYDTAGNQIEQMNYRSDGSIFLKRIFKYDNSGNQIEATTYPSSGELLSLQYYIYSKNQVEVNHVSPADGTLYAKYIYKYDGNKNIIGLYFFDNADSNKNYKYEFVYDKNNKLIQEKYFNHGLEYAYELFEYNEKGNVIEKDYFFNEKLKSKTTYEYKYDQHDNWIEKITVEKGFPSEIIFPEFGGYIQREITYN